MLDAKCYISNLTERLLERFGNRLIYVGLQGSYLRGEATEDSDIDVMAVLDSLSPDDLDAYRRIIAGLPDVDKSCGFICGRDDLARWNPLEIAHLLHTTRDYYGHLDALVPRHSLTDARHFVQLSAGNLYHELCHRYVHGSREANERLLPGCYRQAFFILQNLRYVETGEFALTRSQLAPLLSGPDAEIMAEAQRLCGDAYDFDHAFALLFAWCQDVLRRAQT